MDKIAIKNYFLDVLRENEDLSVAVAAIKTLLEVLNTHNATTVQELDSAFGEAILVMKNCDQPITAISSACNLFKRFITLGQLDNRGSGINFKSTMATRGDYFLQRLSKARSIIVEEACNFVNDGCRILTHSKSRVVFQTLVKAAETKRFEVFVTKSSPDNSGETMHKQLLEKGIDSKLILDSSIGYMMEQVDIVMLGAEGVVESGGIINKIGTYTLAMCAKELKKPVYVLTECIKFTRTYPLNQTDLPNEFKYLSSTLKKDLSREHPLVDYTPPSYITLLFTDIGIFTPSAVSDELIKLYL